MLLLSLIGKIYAEEKLQKDSTIEKKLDNLSLSVKNIDTSINHLKDTLNKAVSQKEFIDSSQLAKAQKNEGDYLYKDYFFKKGTKTTLQYFYLILAFVVLLFMWVKGLSFLHSSGLCKDPSYDANGQLLPPTDSPFSFARVQLFWWTMIVLSCYVFFFGVTGILVPINETVVILLGLGALVYGTGKVLDNRQVAANKGFRSQDKDAQNSSIHPNLLTDILSDDNGISIHRFQAVIFNIVFGIGFIAYFIQSLNHAYPFIDFTNWQFALMGISSATYLGLKASENNNTDNNAKPLG